MANGNLIRHGSGVRSLRFAALPVLVLAGGCADEIQFQGKIFDVVGLSGSQQKAAEPKLAPRAPLVLPPNNDRLPEPGTPPESVASDVAALNDPDKQAILDKAELAKRQAEYCKVHYEDAKSRGDTVGADLAVGPAGPCRGSVLTAIEKWNKGEE